MALFMSISEGVPEIKLAQVKMKMEFQSLAAFHVTALEKRFDDGRSCGGSAE